MADVEATIASTLEGLFTDANERFFGYVSTPFLPTAARQRRMNIPPPPADIQPVARKYLDSMRAHIMDEFNRLALEVFDLASVNSNLAETLNEYLSIIGFTGITTGGGNSGGGSDYDPDNTDLDASDPGCAAPTQLSSTPFDDALMFVPQVCGIDVYEAVSGTQASLGPAFDQFGDDGSGNDTLQSDSANVVVYGDCPLMPLADTDRSLHWRGSLGTVEETDPLIRQGRLRITIIDTGGGTYKFAAVKSFTGGSITAIGTTTVNTSTEYDVYALWDRSTATVAIWVDGVEEATAEDAFSYVDTPNLPTYSVRLPDNSWCTELAAWNVLVDVEAPPPGIVDTFDRANGPIGDADNGSTWTDFLGKFVVASNQAALTSPSGGTQYAASLPFASADGTLVVTVGGTFGSSAGPAGVVGRITDMNNFIRLVYQHTSVTTLYLQKRVSGTFTTLATYVASQTPGFELKLVMSGSTLEGYIDDVLRVSATDSAHSSVTNHGIMLSTITGISSHSVLLDDFDFIPS